jgi:hypothetical protein
MSEPLHLSSLAARIDSLEAQATRLRADASRFKLAATVACAALVGVTAIGAMAKTAAPFAVADSAGRTRVRLDAGGLHILDANGKERIMVGFNASGQPVVHLNDKTGLTRESMYLTTAQVPGLQQYDAKSNTRATYDLNASGAEIEFKGQEGGDRYYVIGSDLPHLVFGDAGRPQRTYLGLTTQGDGLLRMFNKDAKEVMSIEGQANIPFIRMSEGGTERLYLGVSTQNYGLLTLEDTAGQDQVELQGGASPFMRLSDGSHQARAYMGIYDDGTSGLTIWGADGTSTYKAP